MKRYALIAIGGAAAMAATAVAALGPTGEPGWESEGAGGGAFLVGAFPTRASESEPTATHLADAPETQLAAEPEPTDTRAADTATPTAVRTVAASTPTAAALPHLKPPGPAQTHPREAEAPRFETEAPVSLKTLERRRQIPRLRS